MSDCTVHLLGCTKQCLGHQRAKVRVEEEEAFYCCFTIVQRIFVGQMEGQSCSFDGATAVGQRKPTQTQREHANSTNPTQKGLL